MRRALYPAINHRDEAFFPTFRVHTTRWLDRFPAIRLPNQGHRHRMISKMRGSSWASQVDTGHGRLSWWIKHGRFHPSTYLFQQNLLPQSIENKAPYIDYVDLYHIFINMGIFVSVQGIFSIIRSVTGFPTHPARNERSGAIYCATTYWDVFPLRPCVKENHLNRY